MSVYLVSGKPKEATLIQASGVADTRVESPPEFDEMMRAAEAHDEQIKSPQTCLEDKDIEADEDAKLVGYGPKGAGQPLQVDSFERRRDLVDGAGRCSLGK